MSRITFTHVNSLVQTNLNKNYSKLAKLQEQLSSGKRLTRPSDDPIDATNDLELRSDLNSMTQYKRNADDGMSYLAVVDTTLITMNNAFQAVRERAIQGANDTLSQTERGYIAEEVSQSVLLEMLTIANTTYKGDYVFSGQSTDKKPFELLSGSDTIDSVDNFLTDNTDTALTSVPATLQIWDRSRTDSNTMSGNPQVQRIIPGTLIIAGLTEGTDFDVDYEEGLVTFNTAAATTLAAGVGIQMNYDWIRKTEADISGVIERQVDKGVTMQLNVNVDEVFGSDLEKDSIKSVIGLIEGLHENDVWKIGQSIDDIDEGLSRALSAGAKVGSRFNRVEMAGERIVDKTIETTRIQSEIEDLDFAKAISDFTLQESVYNASLQSATRVLQPSLINFI